MSNQLCIQSRHCERILLNSEGRCAQSIACRASNVQCDCFMCIFMIVLVLNILSANWTNNACIVWSVTQTIIKWGIFGWHCHSYLLSQQIHSIGQEPIILNFTLRWFEVHEVWSKVCSSDTLNGLEWLKYIIFKF